MQLHIFPCIRVMLSIGELPHMYESCLGLATAVVGSFQLGVCKVSAWVAVVEYFIY